MELVMRVEEEFEIEIPDEEASEISTCGQLFEWVARKKGLALDWNLNAPAGVCASSQTFYRVRRGIAQIPDFSTPKKAIAPKTELETLFPISNRRENWLQLQNSLGRDVPNLRFGLMPLLQPIPRSISDFRRIFPPEIATVGDLTQILVRGERTRQLAAQNSLNWLHLANIVSEESGVEIEKITPDSRFVEDLGMG